MRLLPLISIASLAIILSACSLSPTPSWFSSTSAGPGFGEPTKEHFTDEELKGNQYGAPKGGTYYRSSDGRICTDYTQAIYVHGKPFKGYGTACRSADGTWKPVWAQL